MLGGWPPAISCPTSHLLPLRIPTVAVLNWVLIINPQMQFKRFPEFCESFWQVIEPLERSWEPLTLHIAGRSEVLVPPGIYSCCWKQGQSDGTEPIPVGSALTPEQFEWKCLDVQCWGIRELVVAGMGNLMFGVTSGGGNRHTLGGCFSLITGFCLSIKDCVCSALGS